MENKTIVALSKKLKNAPQSVLERVMGYTDALLEKEEFTFKLSEEQKEHLLKQTQVPLEQCIAAEDVYKQLKEKYDL